MANQNILQRAQVKGTTQTIKSYAGIDGQLVVNKTTGDLHVMSGVAGSNKVLPCKQTVSQMIQKQAPAPDLSGYLTKNDASTTYITKNDASTTYITKDAASNMYLSKAAARDNYLGKTDKAQSAKVADSANSVPWSGVSNKPTIPSMWSYGTEDLTAGSSSLATGKLHFVYE